MLVSVLAPSVPLALHAGLLAGRNPALGPLRWLSLFAPAVLSGGLLLVGIYFLARCENPSRLRPSPGVLAGASALIFGIAVLLLAAPPFLFGERIDRLVQPDVARLHVLRERALRHPEPRVREEAARQVYLLEGTRPALRIRQGGTARFAPTAADRHRRTRLRWLASRPGAMPAERRLLLAGDLLVLVLVLGALPVVGHLGRRHRSSSWAVGLPSSL